MQSKIRVFDAKLRFALITPFSEIFENFWSQHDLKRPLQYSKAILTFVYFKMKQHEITSDTELLWQNAISKKREEDTRTNMTDPDYATKTPTCHFNTRYRLAGPF